LLIVGVTAGLPAGFDSFGNGNVQIDAPIDNDERLPGEAIAIAYVHDMTAPALPPHVLLDRLPERPLLRPPIA
jgi:hypothetical protein